jgi:hypothetical protein
MVDQRQDVVYQRHFDTKKSHILPTRPIHFIRQRDLARGQIFLAPKANPTIVP